MQALFDEFLPLGIIKKTSIDEDGILSEGNYDDIRKEFVPNGTVFFGVKLEITDQSDS